MSTSPARKKTSRSPALPPRSAMDLSGINLNLLVALDALLTEVNVTRAAARVGLSQSAMSHSLQRLRELLGDPLLIRGRNGLVLTPRAEQLAAPVHRGLEELQGALRNQPVFEPGRATRRFHVGILDYFASVVVPEAMALLSQEAPGVELVLRRFDALDLPLALERGELDLLVAPPPEQDVNLRQQKLFTEEYVCVVRQDHPLVGAQLDLDVFMKLRHVLISPRGEGQGVVDRALEKRGLTRNIALRVPYFLIAPLVVARTDYILTAPRRMAEAFAEVHPLRLLPPPLPLAGINVALLWHERFNEDPAHRWLRGLLTRAAKASAPMPRTPEGK